MIGTGRDICVSVLDLDLDLDPCPAGVRLL